MNLQLAFGPFRFDARTLQLWRDGSEVKLTPRACAVLRVLAERADAETILAHMDRCMEAEAQLDRYIQLGLVAEALIDSLVHGPSVRV